MIELYYFLFKELFKKFACHHKYTLKDVILTDGFIELLEFRKKNIIKFEVIIMSASFEFLI